MEICKYCGSEMDLITSVNMFSCQKCGYFATNVVSNTPKLLVNHDPKKTLAPSKEGVTMGVVDYDSIIAAFKSRRPEARIIALRGELDFHLTLLHQSMQERNQWEIRQIKDRLNEIRRELMELEEL